MTPSQRIKYLLLLSVTTIVIAISGIGWAKPEHVVYLDKVIAAMNRYYWDTSYHGLDWTKLTKETRTKIEQAPTLEKSMAEIGLLLGALKDHHTRLEPFGLDDMGAQDIYGGIGCVIGLKPADGYCLISEVFPDGPAAAAGMKAGDRIWSVDGKTVKDFVAENVHPVTAIRGKIGSKVTLLVERGDGVKQEVQIERKQIVHEKTADIKRLGPTGEIGYLTWDNFYDRVSDKVSAKLGELSNTKALILDMRGNPGGLIRELVRIAAYLGITDLGKSVSRDGTTIYKYKWIPAKYSKPIAILVDDNTASAAEILSTVAQESGRAKLIGQPTSNGTAAAITYPIGEGYKISITTAQFYTPKGRPYQAPTPPDVKLANPTEDDIRQGRDPWLDAAVKYLIDNLATKASGQQVQPAA